MTILRTYFVYSFLIIFLFFFLFPSAHRQGGLGEAVLSALAEQRNFVVKHLGVDKLPRSGPPTVLVDMFGISARSVAAAVQEIIKM